MIMQPYTSISISPCVTTSSSPGSNTVVNREIARRVLTVGTSVIKGNRHTPNPHSYTVLKQRGYIGTLTDSAPLAGFWLEQKGSTPYVYSISSFFGDFDSNVYNAAVAKIYEQLRGSTDVSIDLVQWRMTLQMLSLHRRLIAGIVEAAKKIKPWITEYDSLSAKRLKQLGLKTKASKNRARRLSGEMNNLANKMADARLEYSYGWRPTANTLQELANGALRPDEPGLLRLRARHTKRSTRVAQHSPINPKVPINHWISESDRCEVVCWFTPVKSVIDNLARISSLNPVSILYEAMPFSFVLDWAWNYGGFLRSYESAFIYRNDFVSGYVSKSYRFTAESKMRGSDTSVANRVTSYDYSAAASYTKFQRTVLGAAPLPKRPTLELKFGLDRTLNALALAKGTLLRADSIIGVTKRR